MLKVKVYNLGRNHVEIQTDQGRYLQSYSSIVVFQNNWGDIFLDKKTWCYSRTTVTFRNKFLGMTSKEVNQKVEMGIFKLIDLN
jgi:hypothetical protein